MATSPARRVVRRATPTRTPVARATQPAQVAPRAEIEYVDINDIVPYEFNARDNAEAIPAVANSIRTFGFLAPCVIDANNVLIAGHTRIEAAKTLGLTEAPCIRASHLTEDQVAQFRLIDNKVAEIAKWDYDLLAQEISSLTSTGIDFTQFGWNQSEIDCLADVVAADCLESVQVAAAATEAGNANRERRAPDRARFVLGEVVFFIEARHYRAWVDGLRQLHEYNEDAIARDLKERLGITE